MVRCECHSHVLEVTNDTLGICDDIASVFYFSIWNQSPIPYCFSDRLKMIWQLIIGKNLSGSDVIVSIEDAEVISKFLSDKVKTSRMQYKNWKQKHGK